MLPLQHDPDVLGGDELPDPMQCVLEQGGPAEQGAELLRTVVADHPPGQLAKATAFAPGEDEGALRIVGRGHA